MKLPQDTLIAAEKITKYLLVPKKRNDKSQWLAMAGYTPENWRILQHDLKNQILSKDALLLESTTFGQLYEIKGQLVGPNGKSLSVCTIWMKEKSTGQTKFITMFPDKKG
jgi:hypothetical protein